MTIKERLDNDLKNAMKNRDERRLVAIRMLKSAIKLEEVEKGRALNEEEIISIIKRGIKQRREAIESLNKGGRQELSKKEEEEIKILSNYLPEQLSEEEIEKIVKETIKELGEKGSNFGLVMKEVMKKIKGKADGGTVSNIVKKTIGEKNET